jgi:predicted DNA-binding transcriptional regulator YafY
MNRTDRLHAIVLELRVACPRGRTGAWLAARFEVSERTVKRDVDALQQAGHPIWAQPGPGGGYVLDAAATLPPLNFTAAEAAAVALALSALPAFPFAADGRTALAKVLAAMPPAERVRATDLAGRLWTRGGEARRPQVARVVDEAVRGRTVIVLTYRDAEGAVTRRAVEPAGLATTNGNWYLMGYCRLRQAPRWFRVDRIRAAHLTGETTPPHDPATLFGVPPSDAASAAATTPSRRS